MQDMNSHRKVVKKDYPELSPDQRTTFHIQNKTVNGFDFTEEQLLNQI